MKVYMYVDPKELQ